jgi:hypothetical protein
MEPGAGEGSALVHAAVPPLPLNPRDLTGQMMCGFQQRMQWLNDKLPVEGPSFGGKVLLS